MDTMVDIFIERANDELLLAKRLKTITESDEIKDYLKIPRNKTFYSSVISHAYYSIFYSAKAILLTKNIKTSSPNVHKKTYDKFEETFVDTGILDVSLLIIYEEMIIKADQLLEIFKEEKWKRGHFTYQTIPQANRDPADVSLKNATKFLTNINKVIKSEKEKEEKKNKES